MLRPKLRIPYLQLYETRYNDHVYLSDQTAASLIGILD